MDKVIIDVREPNEYALGHVEGAINITPAELLNGAKALHGLAKDTPLILYCVSGNRSGVAINVLRSQGFTNLENGINIHHILTKHA